jgi:hypothetical protein
MRNLDKPVHKDQDPSIFQEPQPQHETSVKRKPLKVTKKRCTLKEIREKALCDSAELAVKKDFVSRFRSDQEIGILENHFKRAKFTSLTDL